MFVGFCLTGCAGFNLSDSATSKAVLQQRVAQVWQAKQQDEWGKVFDLSMAQFNPKQTKGKFIRGGGLNVISFNIENIQVLPSHQKSLVKVCFNTKQMGIVLEGVCLTEKWVVHNGKWYLVDDISQSPF